MRALNKMIWDLNKIKIFLTSSPWASSKTQPSQLNKLQSIGPWLHAPIEGIGVIIWLINRVLQPAELLSLKSTFSANNKSIPPTCNLQRHDVSMERRPQRRLPISIYTNSIWDVGWTHRTKHFLCSVQSNPQCSSQSSALELSWNEIWQYSHVGMEAQVENYRDYSAAIQVGLVEEYIPHFVPIRKCKADEE